MRRIISALFLSLSSTLPAAYAAAPTKPIELAANAPERHVVVKGDTLWGISARFLKDPFRWPDLWQLNKEDIKNPHWIYPGQVFVLDTSSGSPRLRLEGANGPLPTVKVQPQERIELAKGAIWSISPETIEPFLTRPLVLDAGALSAAARVIGIQDNRVIAGNGDRVYAVNVRQKDVNWQVFRGGPALVDPETGKTLGHEAQFLGTARVTMATEPTEFVLTTAKFEIRAGDHLLPTPQTEIINYLPRAPERQIAGQVMHLTDGGQFAGRTSVISLNRGRNDGLEVGHVLALDRAGEKIDDRTGGNKTVIQLPDRQNGLVFVFRVYDQVAYALIMEAERPVKLGDRIRTP